MPNKTSIEWTDYTSNPIRFIDKRTGKTIHFCIHKSAGCLNCYSEAYTHRFGGGTDGDGNKVVALEYITQNAEFVEAVLNEKELQKIIKLNNRLAKAGETARMFPFDMTDLFLHLIPDEMIDKFFATAALCPQITFQVLTKRPERMLEYFRKRDKECSDLGVSEYAEEIGFDFIYENGELRPHLKAAGWWIDDEYGEDGSKDGGRLYYGGTIPLPNVWLGVSVEDQRAADERIPQLLDIPAALHWLSLEPLLGPVNLNLAKCLNGHGWVTPVRVNNDKDWGCPICFTYVNGLQTGFHYIRPIDWVVIGGESGTGARLCNISDLRSIVQQCEAAGVPKFVKQLGSRPVINYYDDEFREEYESHGWEWPDPIDWDIRDGQPPLNSLVHIEMKDRKGGDMNEWPEDLRIRELPSFNQKTVEQR